MQVKYPAAISPGLLWYLLWFPLYPYPCKQSCCKQTLLKLYCLENAICFLLGPWLKQCYRFNLEGLLHSWKQGESRGRTEMVLLSGCNYNLDIGTNQTWQIHHGCPFFPRVHLWILQKLLNLRDLSLIVTLAWPWHLFCWPPFGQLWLPQSMVCFWEVDSTSVIQVNSEKGEKA